MNDLHDNAAIEAQQKGPGAQVLSVLTLLAKRKKQVLGIPFVTAVLAAGLSMAMPNVYKASTTILPPQQNQSTAAALLTQLGSVAGAAAGGAGIKNPNDLYVGMLRSRTISDNIIKRFALEKAFELDSLEKTRKALRERTTVISGKDGLIVLEFEDENRERAAQVANAYIDELVKLTKTLAVTEAAKRRLFFQEQLEQTKDNLAKAEVSSTAALGEQGIISVDTETRAIVETAAKLRAQISAKEIQISSMSAFVTSNNPDYQRAREELNSLREQLAKLQNGTGVAKPHNTSAGGLQSMKTLRDVKYNQMLYEILAKQYEIARLDESKESSIIQVLDPAIVPEQKIKPRRAIIVLTTGIFSFLFIVVGMYIFDQVSLVLRDARNASSVGSLKRLLGLRG
ncbi:GumC family protein [Massilia varians]